MDLKVVFVTVCLFALAIYTNEAGIPKCCVKTRRDISMRILRNVIRWEVQQNNGQCDIEALILHVRDHQRPICAHPKLKRVIVRMKNRRRRHSRTKTSI
ncbi:C-C motif chemokine 27a [Notolabrus celidotus]|uniref:C-C motif chemokine 27a n=1 Tax=Notolabrus celidotus TaxID=1203425 RepID=UPI0014902AC9|nr:C-C motif chemokine 27a [Notolabrus celidotus]